jgi:glycosyltransferase involved in cell wall biosynthesis
MDNSTIQISFLITHFNRPLDLLACLKGIKEIPISNYEIVVSDDGSTAENIEMIKSYSVHQLILAPINQGLAANINKGLAACRGEFVIYCQEDFIINPEIVTVLSECFDLLQNKKVDMIRFTSNFNFKKTIPLTPTISRIPKFSFHNLLYNYYQYSDHPFITRKNFYETYGYYQEGTSGRYGETEYAIRILKSKAKIAITTRLMAFSVIGSQSVLANESNKKEAEKPMKMNKSVLKLARAFRLYLEYALYNSSKRGLKTYKNFRKIKA